MANLMLDHLEAFYAASVEISRAKNHDYAGDADPLKNFRLVEQLGVTDTPRGVFIRLLDKVARVARLLDNDPAVAGESLHDTCLDGATYFAILDYALAERKRRAASATNNTAAPSGAPSLRLVVE
jgi:hypothetical protein